MIYFIVERYNYCDALRLVFSSDSLEEAVKAWYKNLEDKDLYFEDGWCDQAIISYIDKNFILSGFAHESNSGYNWNLYTAYDEFTTSIYNRAVKDTSNYYSKIEEYKRNINK